MTHRNQSNAEKALDVVHSLSSLSATLSGMTGMAAIMPVTNMTFGFLAQVCEQTIRGNNVSMIEAYRNGLDYTATVFMVSAVIAVSTHPAVTKGAHSFTSSVCGFFASNKETHADDASLVNTTQQPTQ